MSAEPALRHLFVYGTMLAGEPDHELVARSALVGSTKTLPCYFLVETNVGAGLVEGGDTVVRGELYALDVRTLAACDVHRQHPFLYERRAVRLACGTHAEAYFLRPEQARGRRRLRAGDWRARFAPAPHPERALRGWRR